jgi:hypothetical protein
VKARTTQKFDQQYAEAPRDIQRAFDRKLVLLLQNLRHPSLRAKKNTTTRATSGKAESPERGASIFRLS